MKPAASWVSNTRVTSVSQTRRRIAMSWRPACTDLDLRVGEHAGERPGVGRVIPQRVEHLGAHSVSIATRPWAAALSASAAVKPATILRHVSFLATALVLASTVIGQSVADRPDPCPAHRPGRREGEPDGGGVDPRQRAGRQGVVARLRRGTALWLIDDANPTARPPTPARTRTGWT